MSSTESRERRILQRLGSDTSIDRRSLLISAAAFGAAAATGARSDPAAAQQAVDANRLPIHRLDARPPARQRPAFHKDLRRLVDLNATNQGGAYWSYDTFITPVDDFFIRNEYATPRPELEPRVNPRTWRLKIHGDGVERPIEIGYEDLLRMPSRSIIATMECAGNGRTLFWEQQDMLADPTKVTGTGWGLGGIGQAEWQFVPMSHILGLVGLRKEAQWALFWSGVDNREGKPGVEGDTGRPLPIRALHQRGGDIGLAFKMNGEDLQPDHGAPVRALVPGWCGAASTKWLTEIKISRHSFWVRLNSKAHVMIGPDYAPPKPRPGDEFRFITEADIRGIAVEWSPPKSLITVPLVLEKQPKFPHNYPLKPGELPTLTAGRQVVRGYAWAPQHGVARVEYRIDGGRWQTATLRPPNLGRYTWVRFDFNWAPTPGRHVVETRVTDRARRVQPERVPFNAGGFDFWAVPKFHVEVV